MRMKALRIALAAFVMAALVSQGVLSDEIWTERKLTSGGGWFRGGPEIWGDKVYWTDRRTGNGDVYVWDEAGGERELIGGPDSEGVMAVYEEKIAMVKYISGQYDLYLWDAVNGRTAVCTAPGDQCEGDIYGDTVVWEDHRGAKPQVYMWDPVNGERPISPTAYSQTTPRIWGDTVVWEDGRNGRWDVYMWNPRDGERRLSTALFPMMSPAIYQDRVVMWVINDPYAPWNEPGIWEWTPQGGLRKIFEYYPTDIPQCTGLWGDLVVWGASNVVAWDPVHGKTRVNQSRVGYAYWPSVYGNTVVWSDMNDIYMCTLVPEPSGLTALLGWAGFLALTRRRRLRKA